MQNQAFRDDAQYGGLLGVDLLGAILCVAVESLETFNDTS